VLLPVEAAGTLSQLHHGEGTQLMYLHQEHIELVSTWKYKSKKPEVANRRYKAPENTEMTT
jgi:acetoin utilization deacetylase AcuC-like enzyme